MIYVNIAHLVLLKYASNYTQPAVKDSVRKSHSLLRVVWRFNKAMYLALPSRIPSIDDQV